MDARAATHQRRREKNIYNICRICSFIAMNINTLIYSVICVAIGIPGGSAFAQSMASPGPQQESLPIVAPAKVKRSMNPESIKRAKLTRLRNEVALTDEQVTKVKPIIETYVNEIQATKNDPVLDAHSKRQKLSELRRRYDSDLNTVLSAEQQQKLVSVRSERRTRLHEGKSGSTSGTTEPVSLKVAPAMIQ